MAVNAAGELVGGAAGELVGDGSGVSPPTTARVVVIIGVSSTGVSVEVSPGLLPVIGNGAISKISTIPLNMVTTIERSAR